AGQIRRDQSSGEGPGRIKAKLRPSGFCAAPRRPDCAKLAALLPSTNRGQQTKLIAWPSLDCRSRAPASTDPWVAEVVSEECARNGPERLQKGRVAEGITE